jgi:hypothetical protein
MQEVDEERSEEVLAASALDFSDGERSRYIDKTFLENFASYISKFWKDQVENMLKNAS